MAKYDARLQNDAIRKILIVTPDGKDITNSGRSKHYQRKQNKKQRMSGRDIMSLQELYVDNVIRSIEEEQQEDERQIKQKSSSRKNKIRDKKQKRLQKENIIAEQNDYISKQQKKDQIKADAVKKENDLMLAMQDNLNKFLKSRYPTRQSSSINFKPNIDTNINDSSSDTISPSDVKNKSTKSKTKFNNVEDSVIGSNNSIKTLNVENLNVKNPSNNNNSGSSISTSISDSLTKSKEQNWTKDIVKMTTRVFITSQLFKNVSPQAQMMIAMMSKPLTDRVGRGFGRLGSSGVDLGRRAIQYGRDNSFKVKEYITSKYNSSKLTKQTDIGSFQGLFGLSSGRQNNIDGYQYGHVSSDADYNRDQAYVKDVNRKKNIAESARVNYQKTRSGVYGSKLFSVLGIRQPTERIVHNANQKANILGNGLAGKSKESESFSRLDVFYEFISKKTSGMTYSFSKMFRGFDYSMKGTESNMNDLGKNITKNSSLLSTVFNGLGMLGGLKSLFGGGAGGLSVMESLGLGGLGAWASTKLGGAWQATKNFFGKGAKFAKSAGGKTLGVASLYLPDFDRTKIMYGGKETSDKMSQLYDDTLAPIVNTIAGNFTRTILPNKKPTISPDINTINSYDGIVPHIESPKTEKYESSVTGTLKYFDETKVKFEEGDDYWERKKKILRAKADAVKKQANGKYFKDQVNSPIDQVYQKSKEYNINKDAKSGLVPNIQPVVINNTSQNNNVVGSGGTLSGATAPLIVDARNNVLNQILLTSTSRGMV